MRFLALLTLVLLLPATVYAGTQKDRDTEPQIMIGVLEEIRGHYAGEANFRSVRVLFESVGHEWRAYPSDCSNQDCLKSITSDYPRQVTWNIGISGRNLGTVIARTPDDFEWYGDVGLQKITSKKPIPIAGERSAEYGGYSGDSVLPPLVANSKPYFTDPDLWMKTPPPKEVSATLQSQIEKKLPDASACTSTQKSTEIKINKFYSSKNGWSLSQIDLYGDGLQKSPEADERQSGIQHLNPLCTEGAYIINGVTLIGGFPWVAISPKGDVSYLGEGLRLVDFADYNDSGKSEILFAIDGDNLGGYKLFFDDFKRHAEFKFNYH